MLMMFGSGDDDDDAGDGDVDVYSGDGDPAIQNGDDEVDDNEEGNSSRQWDEPSTRRIPTVLVKSWASFQS